MKRFRVGDTVVYVGAIDEQVHWGAGNSDPRNILTLNTHYIIESVDVHTWHTKLTLQGISGRFNSVHFEKV